MVRRIGDAPVQASRAQRARLLVEEMAEAAVRLLDGRIRWWPGPLRAVCSAQPVELARVVAGDLPNRLGRQVTELLLDVLRGLGPHAIRMRVVGAPHEGLHAEVVDELGADGVELEG